MSESRLLDRFLKKGGQLIRLWNPKTLEFEVQRTPTVHKYVTTASAGSTALWTPNAGKRVRILGGIISISKEAACAGAENVAISDVAAVIVKIDLSAAALVATGNVIIASFTLPGNGYLCALADTSVNVVLNGALTAGTAGVTVWGCEE